MRTSHPGAGSMVADIDLQLKKSTHFQLHALGLKFIIAFMK